MDGDNQVRANDKKEEGEEEEVQIPFSRPTAYPQQRRLMSAIYRCIDKGGIGVFESPTG